MGAGYTLIGTLPAARLESQQLEPPGKITVTYVQEFYDTYDATPPGGPDGLTYAGFSIERPVDGGLGKIRWKYVGGKSDVQGGDGGGGEGGGGGGDVDPMQEVAELQISLDQVPLGAHPNISKIMKRFGGTVKDGELSFPLKDPTGTSKRTSVDSNGDAVSVNPFHGITSYFAPRVVFRLRRLNPSSVQIGALGKVDAPPWPGGGGNWLKTAVTTRKWGRNFESIEEWLYASGGWSTASKIYPPIYERA